MIARTTKSAEFAKFLLMRELDPEGIRRRIRQARKELSLTQQELADALQVHKRTVENYENVRVPPWDEIAPLAAVLGVSVAWLLHGDEIREAGADAAVVERLAAVEQGQGRIEEQLAELLQRLRDAQDEPGESSSG